MPPIIRYAALLDPVAGAPVAGAAARAGGAARGRDAPAIPLGWLLGATAGLLGAVVVAMLCAGLTFAVHPPLTVIVCVCAAGAAAILYRCRAPTAEPERIVRDATAHAGLFTLICIAGAIAPYPLALDGMAFADPTLAHVDRALGFDWVALYRIVAAHPLLQTLERTAYHSIFVTPAILLGYFAYKGWTDHARRFILTFWLAAVLTLLAFALMPARGPLATLWHGPLPYMPINRLTDSEVIVALRLRELREVDLGSLCGLVGAPSFHTASAILFAVAAWPSARLRWPIAFVNLAMLVATPVEGTHYLTDMLLGALVAALALAIAAPLGRVRARRRDDGVAHA